MNLPSHPPKPSRRKKSNNRTRSTLLISFTLLQPIISFESPPTIPTEQLTCRPTGLIQDTSCNFETIDEVNRKLHAELSNVIQLPIFRYHKVDLYRQCPFWSEDGLCGNRACAVDELDKDEIPAFWRTSELSDLKTTTAQDIPIDLKDKCVVKEQDYCVLDGDNGMPSNGVYVDLLANPERFTGYSGASAHRVWRAIYQENCFDTPQRPPSSPFTAPSPSSRAGLDPQPDERNWGNETCLEKRVYYKLLSGIHTSISMHICDEYLDPSTGQWVPNLQCYLNRIGLHPERLENLYFAYTLMLRALSRSASYLSSSRIELCTGDKAADEMTRQSLDRLITIAHSYPVSFDETSMFKTDPHSENTLKDEFKEHFRNVSRIMDCVGCDKCRLWGKLQIMGLGTGLKLLFEYEQGSPDDSNFQLTRPELLAFINTLNRLSESVAAVDKFTKLWQQRSLEGTLPDRIKDEKLDSFASGRAAKAISLSSGLGSNLVSSSISSTSNVNKKVELDQTFKPLITQSKPTNSGSESMTSAPTASPSSKSSNPSTNPKSSKNNISNNHQNKKTSYPTSIHHSSPNNRSDSTTGWRVRSSQVVVDIALSVKQPASKLFKMFSDKCKHSIAACTHWIESLFSQVKPFIFFSSSTHSPHHPDHQFDHNPPPNHNKKNEL